MESFEIRKSTVISSSTAASLLSNFLSSAQKNISLLNNNDSIKNDSNNISQLPEHIIHQLSNVLTAIKEFDDENDKTFLDK